MRRGSGFERAPVVLLACLLLVAPDVLAAESNARECIAAHAKGQEQRAAGLLLSARERFLSCSVDRCPSIIERDCVSMEADLERAIPTIILSATDQAGRDLPSATANIDAAAEPSALDGRPIALDPGSHHIEFRFKGQQRHLTLLLNEGEKYRRVSATFDLTNAAQPQTKPGASPLAYVFGGVGIAALASFVIFGLEGKSKQNELERCRPNCNARDVAVMRTRYHIADISLATSLASLGLSAYFFIDHADGTAQKPAAARERSIGIRASAEF